jgi:hypothetical protein
MLEHAEFTTQIGCPIACLKYCPQEIITKQYQGERTLSLEDFKKFLHGIPKEVSITFAGVSEPFQNPQCVDMILHANSLGYKVNVFSTLVGLTMEDAARVCAVDFNWFELHLPDACGNAHIQTTQEYKECLVYILTHVKNIKTMNMGGLFETNHVEDMIRGTATREYTGRVTCALLRYPNYQIHPNGNVFFCCMTRGVRDKVGSLHENTYPELVVRFPAISERLATDPDSICHYCVNAKPYWKYVIKEIEIRLARLV